MSLDWCNSNLYPAVIFHALDEVRFQSFLGGLVEEAVIEIIELIEVVCIEHFFQLVKGDGEAVVCGVDFRQVLFLFLLQCL